MVPANEIDDGEVAVKPPLYVCVPPEAPSVRVPVLPKVTALVIVPLVPVSETLLTLLFTTKAAGLTAPVKLTVPPTLSSVNVPVPANDDPETSAPATAPVERVRL